MNKAKRFLTQYRLASSLFSTHPSRTRAIHKQVTDIAHFSTLLPVKNHSLINSSAYIQNHLFSSKPESFLEIFSSKDWPEKLEKQLQDSNLGLTHETVVYVLKKLSKDPKKASKFMKWVLEEKDFEPNSSIYSLILRIYVHKDFMKQFWATIEEMKEKGYYIDEETYKTISGTFRGLKMETEATALKHFYERLINENNVDGRVKEVVDVIKSSDWGEEVEGTLEGMEITVSDNFLLRVFKELRGRGSPLKAYRFFKWVEKNLSFKHNSVTYNGILRVLCWEDTIGEFWSVFEEMRSAGFELDIDTHIKVSRQLKKNKMLSDVVKLYEHMMDSSYKPSDSECNSLLQAISRCSYPDLDLMYRVVSKFVESGKDLSKSMYDGIHRSLTGIGFFDEAEKVIEKMRDAGFEPDNITYSQLVFGLCKAKRLDEAKKVLEAMEEQGCVPDIKTWTILIKGHITENEINKALDCFVEMTEKGFDADADLVDVLVNGFISQSRTVVAHEMLVALAEKFQVRPWQATYKLLIQKLLEEKNLEEAMTLLRMMKKHKYPPFAEPFVKHVSKFGSVEDALEFLEALSKDHPTVTAYAHVFRAFFEEGRHLEAKDLLFKCPPYVRKHKDICSFFGSAI